MEAVPSFLDEMGYTTVLPSRSVLHDYYHHQFIFFKYEPGLFNVLFVFNLVNTYGNRF